MVYNGARIPMISTYPAAKALKIILGGGFSIMLSAINPDPAEGNNNKTDKKNEVILCG